MASLETSLEGEELSGPCAHSAQAWDLRCELHYTTPFILLGGEQGILGKTGDFTGLSEPAGREQLRVECPPRLETLSQEESQPEQGTLVCWEEDSVHSRALLTIYMSVAQ